jgi:cytosine/uracil/thiamine/allantoin permease
MAPSEKQNYELASTEHGEPSSIEAGSICETTSPGNISTSPAFWKQVQRIPGFERQGIDPIIPENRKDRRYINFFSLYFSMNFNLLAVSTGMSGTLAFGLSLRDTSLVALFFGLLCAIVPAYMTTWGPRTGLRQMIMARHVFG